MTVSEISQGGTESAPRQTRPAGSNYKWIALSNTTLGVLLGAMDGSIILISLPDIFKGLHVNPLAPAETGNLLWMLLGYQVMTATLLVMLGRLADIRGRVRIYNLGFLVFSIGSILLYFVPEMTPQLGDQAVFELILFRLVQGIGGACLIANSTAILTDAFPPEQRGLALGINMVAALGGSLVGLLLGGFLSAISWRLVFLISVPLGILGTAWAYLSLRDQSVRRSSSKMDFLGNFCLAGGLILLLVAMTYGLMPYGTSNVGWGNPLVLGGVVLGLLMLVAFVYIERRVADPLFNLDLFKIRPFTVGCIAQFLVSIAYGGLQLMFIIWLQGVWLPLHGYRFEDTPLWSAIYLMPLLVGYMIFGVSSGFLTARISPRLVTTVSMVILTGAFLILRTFPADFAYPAFAAVLFVIGACFGAFSAPNTTSVMNALPREYRGVGSGMRSTFQMSGNPLSLSVYFTVMVLALSLTLPGAIRQGLESNGVPEATTNAVANLPPTGAMFAVFLGYNPMQTLLPEPVLNQLKPEAKQNLLSTTFFPNAISGSFIDALSSVFLFSAGLSFLAAIFSALRGRRFIYEEASSPGDTALAASAMH
jgi:MFS family permease